MKFLILTSVLLVVPMAPSGYSAQPEEITRIYRNQEFLLTKPALVKLKRKALAGDPKASFEVFTHYSWGLRDDAKAEPWLRLSDKLGSHDAKSWLKQWRIAQPSKYARYKKGKKLPTTAD